MKNNKIPVGEDRQKGFDFSIKNLKEFIIKWNTYFPFDRWWREKHNIAFNSLEHRKANLLDMKFEYEESLLFSNYNAKQKFLAEEKSYYKATGSFIRSSQLFDEDISEDELNDLFDSLNLDDFTNTKIEEDNGGSGN